MIALAVLAGGAAWLLSGSKKEKVIIQEKVVEAKRETNTTDILVSTGGVNVGTPLNDKNLAWKAWPNDSVNKSYIKKSESPNAIEEYKGALSRYPLFAGEPINSLRVFKTNGKSGVMAALLPQGMRAVAMPVSALTGAGGFVLPNDRVDVLLTRKNKSNNNSANDGVVTETLLSNIRVLAIDQNIQEKDGQPVVVGSTATLELTPSQAMNTAAARQSGELSLALRSLADANVEGNDVIVNTEREGGPINVIRFGVSTQVPVNTSSK